MTKRDASDLLAAESAGSAEEAMIQRISEKVAASVAETTAEKVAEKMLVKMEVSIQHMIVIAMMIHDDDVAALLTPTAATPCVAALVFS